MKQDSKRMEHTLKPSQTVGLDLGDSWSSYSVLDGGNELVEEGRIRTTEAGLRKQFAGESRMRIGLEAGTHSAWVSRLLEELGHEVIVANPRKLAAISSSKSKNDRNDAEMLARLAAVDPKLLSPVRHRGAERQQDLNLLHVRSTLVRARTMLINALRGLVKSAGGRLPSCSSTAFATKAAASVPEGLRPVAGPLLEQIAQLTLTVRGLDRQIEALAQKYPEIVPLRTVPGVGPVVAACYVLTLDNPRVLKSNRQAGAYLGLQPGQGQSGGSDPQQRITRTGNTYLRSLLVQSAQYLLGRFAPDSALRRWGLALAAVGGKRGKRRAVVAVARKLAVLLHSLWRSGEHFQPFPQTPSSMAAAAAA